MNFAVDVDIEDPANIKTAKFGHRPTPAHITVIYFQKFGLVRVNPILHGLLEIHYHMGGDQKDPPY